MATTTHAARRRQRPTRRTTASTAHARAHRPTGSDAVRRTRSAAPGAVAQPLAPDPIPAVVAAAAAEPAPKTVRPIRTPDSDDHLAAYFRQLAEHELLTPEDERELSQGIEDTEILTWERVLSRPDAVAPVLALVEPNLEQPVKFPNLTKAIEDLQKTKRAPGAKKDTKGQKKLAVAAREAALALRALDLDRVHIDAVVRDLYRAREAALAGQETWFLEGATKDAGTYVDDVRQAHRDAANLRDEFVRANLRLVVTMARRYDRGGMPLADLIQEGNLGLMHAVSRFDYRRGLRFSTYACWWIRHAIGRALADKARAVRIPVHMLEAQQQLEKVRQTLVGELGRPPTPQELAKAARVPLAKLNQMHRYIMGQPMSLDRPIHDDDDRSFGDTMADPDSEEHSPADDLTTQTLTSQVKRLLHHLSPIEADVLTKRFGLGDDEERTFREIGDQYHLSRERIRQIQNSALDKLKRALEREHRGHVEM
ncbi:MAG: polymerase, sigma 32 subunit, RpoH [Myxococcales bacterium]|nr:polymerase, sigma 32 subunit, RpoH [Myxococcales bacterium]